MTAEVSRGQLLPHQTEQVGVIEPSVGRASASAGFEEGAAFNGIGAGAL